MRMMSTPGSRQRRKALAMTLAVLIAALAAGCAAAASAPTTQAVTTTSAVTTTRATTTTGATTTTQAVTTTSAATTTTPEKTPAATVEELITALYGALNAQDDAAFRALSTQEAQHAVYWTDGTTGSITATFDHADLDLGSTGIRNIELLGAPVVSGDAVAIPVRYTYPDGIYTGFDLLVVAHVAPSGLLVAGGASFLGAPGFEADGAVVADLSETESTAWNADDVAGVLATMTDDALFWEDVTDADSARTGAALQEFVTGSVWFDVEITGVPVLSGPFAAVPNRLVAGGNSAEGISIYWIRDGKIALQAFGQGL
jgi:hypothetical protein